MAKSHTRNPLFPTVSARRSAVAKMVRAVKNRPSIYESVMTATGLNREIKNMGKDKEVTNLLGSAKKIAEQYAKGGASRQAVERLLSRMGPAGDIMGKTIKSLGKITSHNKELSFMQKLLEAFGIGGTPKKGKKPPSAARAGRTVREMNRQVDRAMNWLSHLGVEVPGEDDPVGRRRRERKAGAEAERQRRKERRKPETVLPQGQQATTTKGQPRRYVDVKVDGTNKRFPVDHPIITGAMVPVSSSNVHSFSYDLDMRVLYVRFLGGKGKQRVGPGPLYSYHHVPGGIFLAFVNAASAGKFVWKKLRIEGTLSGHQYDYTLVGVTGNYVPRKATVMAGGEGVVERSLMSSSGERLTSKPSQLVRKNNPYKPKVEAYSRGAPAPVNRARPNRAEPNRGR